MSTTDVVPFKRVSLQLQGSSTEVGRASVWRQPQGEPLSELGYKWNMEAGLASLPRIPPSDYRPVMNLKWSRCMRTTMSPPPVSGWTSGVGFAQLFSPFSKTLDTKDPVPEVPRPSPQHQAAGNPAACRYRGTDVWRALVGFDLEAERSLPSSMRTGYPARGCKSPRSPGDLAAGSIRQRCCWERAGH
jgi:hypothetical protein